MTVSPEKQEKTHHQLNNLTSKIKRTIFKQFLEIVGVTRQLQYECRATNFLRNVIIEELQVVFYVVDVSHFIYLGAFVAWFSQSTQWLLLVVCDGEIIRSS